MSKTRQEKLLDPRSNKNLQITQDEKILIWKLWRTRVHSKRKLASIFGISRRSVDFITVPDRQKENQELAKKNENWKRYYNKNEKRVYMRKYRAKKKKEESNN